ncbi:alpha/beta hydrolase [Rhodococcus maanshanensis]|uniref:alpha/beta fold hydrolase n=1 Tax=Rhodococcus maanshanensis TaxID=183556 RepID=UPI0022B4D93D|nr:alpha/beta hydrolase [Rhodococcus maanshanensis]MCZ4556284.1 alpha/beta hydrolase [Rhodococcus maanshanensis]
MTTAEWKTALIPTDLGNLAVHIVGEGRPVVAWHSMFVDSSSWSRLTPHLPGRRFFLIDAPSCGASEALAGPVDISACARAAAQVITALAAELGGQPIDWLGNAWGGHVGMELAAIRPDMIRSLVAISAPTFPIGLAVRLKIRLLLPLYRAFGPRGPVRSAIMSTILTDATRKDDLEAVALIDECLAKSGSGATITAIRSAILNRTDLLWAARALRCPTLFVTTDDRGEWTPEQARAVVAQMSCATEVTITDARVIPALEQPVQVAAALRQFWARQQ